MPRRIREELAAADVEQEAIVRRCRQLSLRLRMCAPRDGEMRQGIEKELRAAAKADPRERLSALLDLADQVRVLLAPAVERYTLPPSLNDWRVASV